MEGLLAVTFDTREKLLRLAYTPGSKHSVGQIIAYAEDITAGKWLERIMVYEKEWLKHDLRRSEMAGWVDVAVKARP